MNTQSTRHILGIPVSFDGLSSMEARLRGFEPENPQLFVPRTFGAGWDLNIGAVAVRLGLIRPDDSLPDLAAHIPASTITTLRLAPVIGALTVATAGVCTALTHDRLPSNWSVTLSPTRWSTGPAAMATPVLISVGSGVCATMAGHGKQPGQPRTAVDVTSAAQSLGLQTMSLLLILAATRRADNPEASRLLPAAGLIAAPVVSTGVFVSTVRGALKNLDNKLRQDRHRQNRLQS